jgi:hypothetical protein
MTWRTSVSYPVQIAPTIVDIVITWGALEESMDKARATLSKQPECAGIASVNEVSKFKVRAFQFEALCKSYFASCPAMVSAYSRLYNDSVKIQIDRNYVVHGMYGFTLTHGELTQITLSSVENGQRMTRHYSPEDLQKVADTIGFCLWQFGLLSHGSPWEAFPTILQEKLNIPNAQVGHAQTLIDRIHRAHRSTTR